MAVFIASNNAVRFDLFNVAGLLTGMPGTSNATTFSIGPDADNFTTFSGTGFTYSGGLVNSGTINRIDVVTASQLDFRFDNLSMPVAQFRAFSTAGNSQGFLAAALAGNDTLTGSAFADYLQGFAGNDLIQNDPGNDDDDTLDGGTGNDTLVGADGEDSLLGALGNDQLSGGGGGDALNGGIGADTMDGGDGNDFYFVDNAKDVILTDSSGIDSLQSTISYVLAADLEHLFLTGAGKLTGTGNASANQIVGSTGANKLLGLDANDFLDGGAGNDTLDGGTGDDTMLGGAGNDTYFAGSKSDQVSESIAGKAGGIDMVFSSADITLGANIENLTLIGTGPGLVANGNALNNVIVVKNATGGDEVNDLHGHGGNDTLIGAAGNDALDGGSGADVMVGGGSDDFYSVDDGDKVIETLAGPSGGNDLVTYSGSKNYTLGANIERLDMTPTSGDLSGFGNGLSNQIIGNFDNNLIDGKSGADTMLGLDGDDVYVVDNALDRIDEQNGVTNGGIDTVRSAINFSLSDNGTTVQGEFEHLILLGKASIGTGNGLDNRVTGNAGRNLLSGLDGNDTLDGGTGNDTMQGAAGNDIYVIDSKLDVVIETGTDLADQIISSKISVDISAALAIENIELRGKAALNATGNDGKNTITGNDGANKLFGLAGDDAVVGGSGNDTLDGGIGADSPTGGTGNDTYIVDNGNIVIGDKIQESDGGGIDTVISSAPNFTLKDNVENLTLAPGAGNINGRSSNNLGNVIIGNEGNNDISGGEGNDTIDGGTGNDTLLGSGGDDIIVVSGGNDTVRYFFGAGHELIKGFDGNPIGGQDVLDLDGVFDNLVVASPDRASHVLVVDNGSTVDVRVDADSNLVNGYELTVATIQTTDAVTIGEDVLLGTL